MQILAIGGPYASAPVTPPTSLSMSSNTTTSITVSFTPPSNDGGATITNYEYSFNNSTWTAFSPADSTSPVTISGLSPNSSYTIYLRAVNIVGSGAASSVLSASTQQEFAPSVEYLVVAGGGGGSGGFGVGSRVGGGGAGGMLTASGFSVTAGQSYTVTVGAGGGTTNGSNSVFSSITCIGGGTGAQQTYGNGVAGGSGGGASGSGSSGGAGTAGQGNRGGQGGGDTGHGGGGKGAVGGANNIGGAGQASSISGTSVTYAKGGNGWNGGEGNGTANTGNGAGGIGDTVTTGGSGIVILRYTNNYKNLTSVSGGLTYTLTDTGGYKIYRFTAGTGTITV